MCSKVELFTLSEKIRGSKHDTFFVIGITNAQEIPDFPTFVVALNNNMLCDCVVLLQLCNANATVLFKPDTALPSEATGDAPCQDPFAVPVEPVRRRRTHQEMRAIRLK